MEPVHFCSLNESGAMAQPEHRIAKSRQVKTNKIEGEDKGIKHSEEARREQTPEQEEFAREKMDVEGRKEGRKEKSTG